MCQVAQAHGQDLAAVSVAKVVHHHLSVDKNLGGPFSIFGVSVELLSLCGLIELGRIAVTVFTNFKNNLTMEKIFKALIRVAQLWKAGLPETLMTKFNRGFGSCAKRGFDSPSSTLSKLC